MALHYLEIVSPDVNALIAHYERVYALKFGAEEPEMGQARIAKQSDGSLIGIRKPLAEHESPIVRTYLAAADLEQAVKLAEAAGAQVAYPPTRQGDWGRFAIVLQGGVQHGLWQK